MKDDVASNYAWCTACGMTRLYPVMVERKKYIEFHFCTIRHFIIDDEKNLDRKRCNLGDTDTRHKVMRLDEANIFGGKSKMSFLFPDCFILK